MLLRKRIYALQEVGDLTLSQIESICSKHLSECLFKAEKESIARTNEECGYITKGMFEDLGKFMSINTDIISFEKAFSLEDHSCSFANNVIENYMILELKTRNKQRLDEYRRFICNKQLQGSTMVSIKIFKIGNVEYFCYTVE